MNGDAYVQVWMYWALCLLLAAGGLLKWSETGHRSHLWFVARQVALTIAVTLATISDCLPALVVIWALMAVNVLTYQTIKERG